MHALGLEFGSAAQLSKRPGSVWNCLWGNALKRSPGIIRKSRVSYPGPGFLSSATWPSLPKKHYNGLNQIRIMNKWKKRFGREDMLHKETFSSDVYCYALLIYIGLNHMILFYEGDLLRFISSSSQIETLQKLN